jgi:hypothetical protein
VAELERSLIVERVKAGLRNARVKGKRLSTTKVSVDSAQIMTLRRAGRSWSESSKETGCTKGTVESLLPVRDGLRAHEYNRVETGLIYGAVHYVVVDQPEQVTNLIERYASISH